MNAASLWSGRCSSSSSTSSLNACAPNCSPVAARSGINSRTSRHRELEPIAHTLQIGGVAEDVLAIHGVGDRIDTTNTFRSLYALLASRLLVTLISFIGRSPHSTSRMLSWMRPRAASTESTRTLMT